MKTSHARLLGFVVLVFISYGCASVRHTKPDGFESRFFAELDNAADKSGVRDASSVRIPEYPNLRANRFLAAMKQKLETESEKRFWVERMRQLDLEARQKEIRNLPESAVSEISANLKLTNVPNRSALTEMMKDTSAKRFEHDQNREDFFESLTDSVRVPDEYAIAMRIFGLYPIAALPVLYATNRANERVRSWHAAAPEDLPITGQLVSHCPVVHANPDVTHLFSDANADPFGLPVLNDTDRENLATRFAPMLIQESEADYDRFGSIEWQNNRITVNTKDPTVYYYFSEAFRNGQPILQINYTIWYTERNGPKSPWIERGTLDGLTIRISLDEKGAPFMTDMMNSCGCYHFFLPEEKGVKQTIPVSMGLDPLVPGRMPDFFPDKRLAVTVCSGWHQVVRVASSDFRGDKAGYRLLPYAVLESLPRTDGTHAGMFDPDGIAKNSERIEPYIFFSMGVPNVGSMRQRGHHAIKLVGRSHFDDPFLFDKSFVFK